MHLSSSKGIEPILFDHESYILPVKPRVDVELTSLNVELT